MLIKALLSLIIIHISKAKYIEGELFTYENWAFIARFCFLSEDGQFEYYFEYNEDQGTPNLLLYYDADDQWPAVYKTTKTCPEKEAVLSTDKNQVVNLTTRFPIRELSGCSVAPIVVTQSTQQYTISVPTPESIRKANKISTGKVTVTSTMLPITTIPISVIKTDPTLTEPITTTVNTVPNDNFDTTLADVKVTSTISTFSTTDDVSTTTFIEGNEETTTELTEQIDARPKRALNYNRPFRPYDVRLGRTVVCKNAKTFRSSRERWWFIAISNCNSSMGIRLKYKILMTNGLPGDYWHQHFSADEFYILPVLMAFCIAYSFLILMIVICSIELKSRQLLHTTYKLFCLSVFVQMFGILLNSMAYLKYAVNGVGAPKVKMTGSIFMGCSETCFLLLLLLLAKGYTVTRGRLPLAAGVKLTVFMCLYAVTYISLFIYEAKVFDPGEVLYLYESPAGYGLIILRLIAWCMFIYSTVFTLKHYPEKANFYYPFNVFATLWFVAGPSFILSANSYIDKWIRESVVCGVLLFISFAGHIMFMLLTMPSVANKNFPYHVRTTQICVMELTGTVGSSSIEQFGHHVYEPTPGNVNRTEQSVIVPLTKRTEEIFKSYYISNGVSMRRELRRRDSNATEQGENNGEIRNGTLEDERNMENVIGWSMAKNVGALEVPFQKGPRDSTGSAHSRSSETSNSNPANSSFNGQMGHTTQDWVKEVPVELFTISRMVITQGDPNGRAKSPRIQEVD